MWSFCYIEGLVCLFFLVLILFLLFFLKTTKEKLKIKLNELIVEKNNNCWIGRYKLIDLNNEILGELFFFIYWIVIILEYWYVVLYVWC